MNEFIITGASRGLGAALAKGLLAKHTRLHCIARSKNSELLALSRDQNCFLEFSECDLNEVAEIEAVMTSIFRNFSPPNEGDLWCLINNAAVVEPIRPIERCTTDEIVRHMNINLIAPMVLTSQFIHYTDNFDLEKRVLNISSGAGKKPYYGWSSYCSSKAGIDLFTRCVGVEQGKKAYPVKILSLAPGIIDTGMQNVIRSSAEADFQQVERFKGFKNEGKLLSPETVASKIIDLLWAEVFLQGGELDIKDLG